MLQHEVGESGVQAHQYRGPVRRVNGGHEIVYGLGDDEQSKRSPRAAAGVSSWLGDWFGSG